MNICGGGRRSHGDDGAFKFAFKFGSTEAGYSDIELGARILYDHCVTTSRWGMMPHTAGKTVAMYFGQPVAIKLEPSRVSAR